jgi:hypothetical protein
MITEKLQQQAPKRQGSLHSGILTDTRKSHCIYSIFVVLSDNLNFFQDKSSYVYKYKLNKKQDEERNVFKEKNLFGQTTD